MQKAIFGKKIGMSQFFTKSGDVFPVTIIEVQDTFVSAQKTINRDGYLATQIATGERKRLKKSQAGHLKVAKIKQRLAITREVPFIKAELGDRLTIKQFSSGDRIKAFSKAKGKGFAGTVKRHGFTIGPKSHGSKNMRKPGSIGSTYPQRVVKGKKMAGHMGNTNTSAKNLEILSIDEKNNLIVLKGSVPGPKKSLMIITKS